ncbi:MAG: PAS domain S-box protein [Chloroflexota bacterium]|nr:PAS domain S-box protein [Chloroflexota bacterium]
MKKPTRILIAEHVAADAELAQRMFRKIVKHCDFQVVETRKDFLVALETQQPDIILADADLPQFPGMQALKLARKHTPLTPFILWTGSTGEDFVVTCIKAGASNCLLKENLHGFGPVVRQAIKERQLLLERELAEQRYQVIFERSPEGIFQSSPEGRFLKVNPALANLYGYASPQDMIESVVDIASQIYTEPGERAHLIQMLEKHGTIKNYEQKNRCRDGSVIWTSSTMRAVHDTRGNLLYIEGFVRDITARKTMEEQLRQGESRFRTLVEQLPVITYISQLDQYMGVSYISPQIATLGFDPEQWLADPEMWFRQIHPEDQERVSSALEQFREGGEEFRTEYRLVLSNGETRWFDDRSVYIRDQNGQPIFKQGFMLDITERKQAEEALQRSESRFRALIENGLDDISLLAADGTLLWESPSTIRNLGYQPNEFVGRNIFEIMHPDDLPWTSELYAQLIREPGSRKQGTFRLRRADGAWRWMEAIVTNMLSQPGIDAIIVNYRDVTEQKQAEQALRESQARYQNLVETSHDLIWSVDLEGNLTFLNHAATEILGYEPQKLLGRSFMDLIDAQRHGSPELQKYRDVLEAPKEFQADETYVRHSTGREVVLSTKYAVTRDAEGNVLGISGTSHDITARKQAEEALQAERNLLRTLIDNLPDRIYAMDTQGRKILSNTADWQAAGGKVMQDVIGKTDFDTYPTELAEQFWQLDQAVIKSGKPVINHEEPGLDAEGNPVFILTTKIPLLDERGQIAGLVGVGRDITERKLAEARINELLEFNKKILSHSPLGILTYELTGKCIFANENAAAILGASAEELQAQNFHEIEAWKKSGLYDLVMRAINTSLPATADIHQSNPGKDVWLTAHCVTFQSKNVAHLLLTLADITDRKLAEERLRQSESRYRLATRATNDVIWEWDPKSNRLSWSRNAPIAFGYASDEIAPYATWWDERLHLEDRERVVTNLGNLVAGDESIWMDEYRFLRKDGSYAYISDRGYVERDADGKALRMIGAMSDITERKQAEVERQALFEIMQGLAQTNDLAELLKLIHQSIARVVYAENFFVVLQQPHTGLFEEIYSVDQYDVPEPPSRLEKSITSYVFRSGEPLLLTQARFEELVTQGEVQLVGTNSKSWLGVPLKTSGRTIGVMAVQDYERERRYSERDRDFLASIAAQVALVIQRKQAEETLREREEQYRAIFEGVQDAILVESTDGSILMVNEQACEMYGYSREEFLTKTVSDLVPPGHTILSAEGNAPTLSVKPFETLNRRASGQLFPIEISGRLLFINGETIQLVVIRDLTESKRAEAGEREQRALAEALRDTAEMLSSTLEYGVVLDHILEAVGRVVPHDAATILLLEHGIAQVVRLQGYEKWSQDHKIMGIRLPVAETANLRQMVETRQPVVVRDTHTYPGWKRLETTEWLRSSVGAPISIYGEVIGFICLDAQSTEFFTPVHAERLQAFANQAALAIHNARLLQQAQIEITERKQAEADLRASEERFRQLADNIQEAFWITDAETNVEIYMSPAVEKIWGRPVDYLLHEPNAFLDSVYPEDKSILLEAIQKEKNGQRIEIEYRIIRPDGSLRWVWDRAFPIFDESGKVIRIAGISADITERRESEMALVQSQRRYRELFDSSPISLWEEDFSDVKRQIDLLQARGVTDLDAYLSSHPELLTELASRVRIVDVNQAALELYQVSGKEMLLKSLPEILSNSAQGHFPAELRGLSSPARRFVWEGSDQMLDGRQMEVVVTGVIPDGYEKDWSKVLVSISEITERKRAEQEVRRRAEEMAALLETSLALTDLDLNTILRTISNSAKALFAADGCRVFLMEPDGQTLRCVLALQEDAAAFSDLRFRIGEGVTGSVAASGRAEIVNQMQDDPRAVQVPGTPNEEEAIMFAPLKERDRTIGVLSIRRVGADRYFEPADLELLEALAAMAASAVSNARLFEETQRRLAQLEALYENGLAVGRLLEPRQIGERIIETFARHLRWHHVTIRLKHEVSDDLELVAFNLPNLSEEERAHAEKHFVTLINKVGQGLSGWAMQTGKALRTGNVHDHPQYVNMHSGIQSGLYMPLKAGERVIGVISVESEEPDAFTAQDERLLATLASQAAIAFENARLYEAIQKELAERKRAEEALRTSEAHYRELADSITDILFEMDHEMRYTHWNKASEVLLGAPASEVIGKSMRDIFGESDEQTRIGKIYESVLMDRQPKTFETTLAANGTLRSFEVNAYPSRRGVSVVAKDVTDRKRAEIIMQKRFELMEYSAHHTLNELIQSTVDEVSELTGSTIGFLHFVEPDQNHLGMQVWSTNALRVFNIPVSEGAHRPLDQAGLWAEAVRQRRPLIQNDYASLPPITGLPAGHEPIVREIVIPIIRSENLVAVIGIANKPQDYTQHDLEMAARLADYAWDITERKQMQIALETERNQLVQRVEERTADLSRANSNLARALRVKDEFLANMSHELRTPLNAILGLSESLAEQIAGPLNEKQQKYITTISESGHHLLALINDILDLAKIEAGQITLDINKVDIHSVCQSSLRMIKQLAQKKNQEVTLTIQQGLGLMWADERRLKQMMVNLLGNAVKFTPENGKLGLEVHGDEEANKVTITVWDTGIGIKAQDLERLFQPFVQLDSGLARETTGTGLGLALVAQMARLHGGSVTAFSEPGVGSRFAVVLPWEPALALDAATRLKITGKFRAIKPEEGRKPTILLVEDTKEVIMMIQDYLELAGYKVVTAQDGLDAIVQAKLVHPDLILMDVQMPRMDGMEATRKLRSESEFRDTPIIALTALAMPNDRERCLAAGMDEYVSKPVNLRTLVKLIQTCLLSTREPSHS